MKFVQLPLGQSFEFDGESWVKHSPFIATHATTGKQKFMARYAVVKAQGQAAHTESQEADGQVALSVVNSAFNNFFQDCSRLMEEALALHPAETREAARYRLEEARRRFTTTMKKPD